MFLKCLSPVFQPEAAPLVKLKHCKAAGVVGLVPTLPQHGEGTLSRFLLQAGDTGLGDSLSHHSQLTLLPHMVTGKSVAIFNCFSPCLEQNGLFQ